MAQWDQNHGCPVIFVNATGQQAHIGALQNIQQVIEGQSGTLIYKS